MSLHYIFLFKLLSLLLFVIVIAIIGLLNSKHIIYVFISIELIFTTIVMWLLVFSKLYDDLNGVVFSLFLLGLIACEAALGLIILISIQKLKLKIYE